MINALSRQMLWDISIIVAGLISPGVSVPIQVPGGGHPDMGSHMGAMTSQYWPRLQWYDSHLDIPSIFSMKSNSIIWQIRKLENVNGRLNSTLEGLWDRLYSWKVTKSDVLQGGSIFAGTSAQETKRT